MKIAVISDVHANLEALEVCLAKIDELKPDKLICLGDLVDYCAQPNECIELVKKNADVVLLGNHDEAQFNYEEAEGFNDYAYISSVHTRSVIKPEYIEYFRTLPYTYLIENLLFVHASPRYPELYRYVLSSASAESEFASFSEKVCFIGHSHRPVIFAERGTNVYETESVTNSGSSRYIINVGSVGQPRDGDPKLAFGFIDTGNFKYCNYRLQYPVKDAYKKIIDENLPVFLADRILKGI
jgi:diadenosine tetraphosphatase ApaH/serine/threonine PP2A family protein phosphatase